MSAIPTVWYQVFECPVRVFAGPMVWYQVFEFPVGVFAGPMVWYQVFEFPVRVFAGPMVWYQVFEYAVGHWFQKATEHVLGCVLCSPGCFSLFRGSALLDDNVMKRYTTRPTAAVEFVQYDQGTDIS